MIPSFSIRHFGKQGLHNGAHLLYYEYTLMSSEFWRSVTILCPDSGLADCLSTALFLMPLEEGRELAMQCGAEVMWVDTQDRIFYTDGFRELLK